MNEIINKDFKILYTLIEKINYECNKRFKFKTTIYLSITEFNSLLFFFTIKYKGEIHTAEMNFHRMEIMTTDFKIHNKLMHFIDTVYQHLLNKINKKTKELKDTDLITVCSKCLQASCWNGEFMCQKAHNAGTIELTVAKLKRLNLGHPDN